MQQFNAITRTVEPMRQRPRNTRESSREVGSHRASAGVLPDPAGFSRHEPTSLANSPACLARAHDMRAARSVTFVLWNDEAVHLSKNFTTWRSHWKRFPESPILLRQMLKTCVNSGKDLQRGKSP
jgi:hypothetical protein